MNAVMVKKSLVLVIIGTVIGLIFAFLILYMEFGGVVENFSPYSPEGWKK